VGGWRTQQVPGRCRMCTQQMQYHERNDNMTLQFIQNCFQYKLKAGKHFYQMIYWRILSLSNLDCSKVVSTRCNAGPNRQASALGSITSTSKVFQVPRTNLRLGSRSFHVSAPILWNWLPHSVRFCESLTTFRKHLKTFYFQTAFSGVPTRPTAPEPQIKFMIFGTL